MVRNNITRLNDGGGISEDEKARRKAYTAQGDQPPKQETSTKQVQVEYANGDKTGWDAFVDWISGKSQGRGLLQNIAYYNSLPKSGVQEVPTYSPALSLDNFGGDKAAEAMRRSKLTPKEVLAELGGGVGAADYTNDAKQYMSAYGSPEVPNEQNSTSGQDTYSLTPEQSNILNKAYAVAQQNALSSKQGTISQAYDEYRRATNPYGSVAENMAAAGLSQGGGYSQYMNAQRFNAYANAANSAQQSYADTLANLDLSRTQSELAYTEQNRSEAETKQANKRAEAMGILDRFKGEYDDEGNITKESKNKITKILKEAGYSSAEIEVLLSIYKKQE